MTAALIIVFREVIEAGLVIGIVLAATRGVARRGLWVGCGVLAGSAVACGVAAFASVIVDAFAGSGQELFNAAVLLLAVLMLGWHNVWMARHGRAIAVEAKALGEAVAGGRRSMAALAIVVAVAVLREGAEVVLFLYGIAVSANENAIALASGGALGVLFGGGLAALMYLGLLRVPTRHLFAVTSWLIALLAAGMAAQAVAFLHAAGSVTMFAETVWDTSATLGENSIIGRLLHTLIGYTDRPSTLQILVYLGTLATIFALMRWFAPAQTTPPPAVA